MSLPNVRSNPQVAVHDNGDDSISLTVVGGADTPIKATTDSVIPAGYSRYIVDQYEIGDGVNLEIEDGAYLEIG